MKAYLFTAAGVIFLSVIVSLLIPDGKLNKSITFVMRMACILVLLQPVTGIFKIGEQTSDEPMYDYVYICKVYSDNQSEQLENVLKEKFGEECDCTVEIIHDDGNFKINSVNVEVNTQKNQIIDEIYAYLEQSGYINITVYAKSY